MGRTTPPKPEPTAPAAADSDSEDGKLVDWRVARHELQRLRQEAARRRGQSRSTPSRSADGDAPAWAVVPATYPIDLDDGRIDPNAAKVVRRLIRHGYEAYLVGGCVRDLLLGRRPKDFDVATSGRPDAVRSLFRNSRIIGRRFRLVHVLFGAGKVIETATFRRNPAEESDRHGSSLLIRRDNVFGEAHEDAARRDFTINGLFYDLERRRVLDWVGGMPDIERRAIHTIGDPVVRFREDPIRILRAIKFCARLDLGMMPDVYDAIVQCRSSLAMAARPRLFEELLRLLRSGAAHRSIWLAFETGVLDVLLPELAAYLSDSERHAVRVWRLLSAVDQHAREVADDTVLWAALLLEPMQDACAGRVDRAIAAIEFLEPVVDRLNVPRRIADSVRRIVALMPRLEAGRAGRFARTPLFALAMEVIRLSRWARGAPPLPQPASARTGRVSAPATRRKRGRPRRRQG